MADKDLSLRDAGARIASSGLTDDVIHADERQIAKRRGSQREHADDDADRRKPKQKARQYEDDNGGDDADDDFEDDAEDDADEATPNQSDEDGDEREDGDSGDDDADEEDGDAGDSSSDRDDEFTVKAGGKELKVTKAELIAGYQRSTDYHQKTTALAQRGRDLTTHHQQAAQVLSREVQKASAIVQGVRQALIGDIDSADMQQLRRTDPNEWRMQRELMRDRIETVDRFIAQLTQDQERSAGELQRQQQTNVSATLDQEREALVRAIPDWDEAPAGKLSGKHRLAKYLTSNGFQQAEVSAVADARMLIVADKARLWDEYQARRTQEPKRKAKTPPRVLRSGQTQIAKKGTGQAAKRNGFDAAKAKARKSGDMRDAGRAIANLL